MSHLKPKEFKRRAMEEAAKEAQKQRLRDQLHGQSLNQHVKMIEKLMAENSRLLDENRRLRVDRDVLEEQLEESRQNLSISAFVSEVDSLSRLPDRLTIVILRHLDVCNIQKASRVCGAWKNLIQEPDNDIHRTPCVDLTRMPGLCPNKALDRALDIVRDGELHSAVLTVLGHERLFQDILSCELQGRPSTIKLDFASHMPSLRRLIIGGCAVELRQLLMLPQYIHRVKIVNAVISNASLTAAVEYHHSVWINVRVKNDALAGWDNNIAKSRELLLGQLLNRNLPVPLIKSNRSQPKLANRLRAFRTKKNRMYAVFNILQSRERDYLRQTTFSHEDLETINFDRLQRSTVAELEHLAWDIRGRPGRGKGWTVRSEFPARISLTSSQPETEAEEEILDGN